MITAIVNQKGGVGKTTTAINVAAEMASRGYRALLVDLDPQGNASTGLGLPRRGRGRGSYALLDDGCEPLSVVTSTSVDNLSLVSAGPELAGAEIELVGLDKREERLRHSLLRLTRGPAPYDVILLDCPPSLGLLTLNALVAADTLLVPLQCEFYALEGVGHLTRTVERVRQSLNRTLIIEGILLTMYDRRNNLSELVAADARRFFGEQVLRTVIPRNVRLTEAPSHGVPISSYDAKSAGSIAYQELAVELLARRADRGA